MAYHHTTSAPQNTMQHRLKKIWWWPWLREHPYRIVRSIGPPGRHFGTPILGHQFWALFCPFCSYYTSPSNTRPTKVLVNHLNAMFISIKIKRGENEWLLAADWWPIGTITTVQCHRLFQHQETVMYSLLNNLGRNSKKFECVAAFETCH